MRIKKVADSRTFSEGKLNIENTRYPVNMTVVRQLSDSSLITLENLKSRKTSVR